MPRSSSYDILEGHFALLEVSSPIQEFGLIEIDQHLDQAIFCYKLLKPLLKFVSNLFWSC